MVGNGQQLVLVAHFAAFEPQAFKSLRRSDLMHNHAVDVKQASGRRGAFQSHVPATLCRRGFVLPYRAPVISSCSRREEIPARFSGAQDTGIIHRRQLQIKRASCILLKAVKIRAVRICKYENMQIRINLSRITGRHELRVPVAKPARRACTAKILFVKS